MRNRLMWTATLLTAVTISTVGLIGYQAAAQAPATPAGWILGEDADTKKNPLPADAATLAAGKEVYKDKCMDCHGPGGVGDGPVADPEAAAELDLTNPKRAGRNPDGVVYYKVLNGRRRPKMPAFKGELTEQQIWSVVTYAQSLRKK
jgi:mono/diheme cytochrome c family protein